MAFCTSFIVDLSAIPAAALHDLPAVGPFPCQFYAKDVR